MIYLFLSKRKMNYYVVGQGRKRGDNDALTLLELSPKCIWIWREEIFKKTWFGQAGRLGLGHLPSTSAQRPR